MRTLNLFIRAVLQEGPEFDPDAVDIISVQPGIDIKQLPPEAQALYNNSNAYLIKNLNTVTSDVKKVLDQHDEVGIRWGRDDYVFLAQGVNTLLKKDAAAGSEYYPYRTALFVITYKEGIMAPIDAVQDAWSYTGTFLKSLAAYNPITYTSRDAPDVGVEELEDPLISDETVDKYGIPAAVAGAAVLGGAYAAKMLKKAGAKAGLKAAARAVAGSRIGTGASSGAIRGVLGDATKTSRILDAIFGEETARSAALGATQGLRSIFRGIDFDAAARALGRIKTAATASQNSLGNVLKGSPSDVAGVINLFGVEVMGALKKIMPEMAEQALNNGTADRAAASKWLITTAGQPGGIVAQIPDTVRPSLTPDEQTALALLNALMQNNSGDAVAPLGLALTGKNVTVTRGQALKNEELRSAVADMFGIFFETLGTQTRLGRGTTGAKIASAGIPLAALGAMLVKAGFGTVADAMGMDPNNAEEVTPAVAQVIGTDIRIRRAAADAASWMTRQPGFGELGVSRGGALEIGASMEALRSLLVTPPAQDVSGAEMSAVAAQFAGALTGAEESVTLESLEETLTYVNTRLR